MSELTNLYDQIKREEQPPINNSSTSFDNQAWKNKLSVECNKLKEDCARRIILDVYCKVLPLDSDYVQGNQGIIKQDVDDFLKNKDMTAMQYLQSCGESTGSPFINKFLIPAIGKIGRTFIEEAQEKAKDQKDNNITISEPEANVNSDQVNSQIVDIGNDNEYDGFISTLKKKTIDKIIKDVSDIINKKKEEKNMTFDLKGESAVSIIMDYVSTKLLKENIEMDGKLKDEILGVAIKEATFNEIDNFLNRSIPDLHNLSKTIRLNRGVFIKESTIQSIMEKGKADRSTS
jgi:hypothetical protein